MDVRIAAEIPNHVGALDLPDVPNLVVANVLGLVEREMQMIEPGGLNGLLGFLGVLLAERQEEIGD